MSAADSGNVFERPEVIFRVAQIHAVLDPERELRFRVPPEIERPMHLIQATVHENTSYSLRRPDWEATRCDRWRAALQHAIQHVADGLAAVHYHRGEIERIERRVTELILDNRDLLERIPGLERGFTVSPRCQPLAFEYQAFLFAERRTLEYLAVAVARFFDRDCHRIKGLAAAIAGQPPRAQRERVEARLQHDLPEFGLSDANRRDARDRLAHWESVDAGQINVIVTASGDVRIAMFGGEEGLLSLDMQTDPGLTLSRSVGARLDRLAGFVFGCFHDLGLSGDES